MTGQKSRLNAAAAANERTKEKQYWLEKLSNHPPRLFFPYDFQPGQENNNQPTIPAIIPGPPTLSFTFPQNLTEHLFLLSNHNHYTLHVILTTTVILLLKKYLYTNPDDITITTPIYRQTHQQDLINTLLPLRLTMNPDISFKELLVLVRSTLQEAITHQNYPLEILLEQLHYQVINNSCPLFDVATLLENIQDKSYLHPFQVNTLFLFKQTNQDLTGTIIYNQYHYQPTSIEHLTKHFLHLLKTAMTSMNSPLSELSLLNENEKKEVVETFNSLQEPLSPGFQPGITIDGLFENRAKQNPNQIALTAISEPLPTRTGNHKEKNKGTNLVHITYQELNQQANHWAGELKKQGVQVNDIVAIMLERSAEMIIAILATLKAGAGYLPIDEDYPETRKKYMLADSNTHLLLTKNKNREITIETQGEKRHGQGISTGERSHQNLLYVIYTSGSTGQPKGVMLEHRNLINLLDFQYRFTKIDFSRVLQFTTISFDVSFQEIFSTLIAGGNLFIIPAHLRQDIPALFRFIEQQHILTLFLPASFVKFVFNRDDDQGLWPRHIHHIITAGEQLVIGPGFSQYLQRNQVTLHNHYGPTESHVVTARTMEANEVKPGVPTIGQPLLNTSIYIVDNHLQPMPIGLAGELLIGGVQVARGYLNKPGLTDEKFIVTNAAWLREKRREKPDGETTTRLYRTGDLAQWLKNGEIEFLGRMDKQVKIRGFRIELGEIEKALLEIKGIKEAVVTARGHEEKYLCAYFVPSAFLPDGSTGTGLEPMALKKTLAGTLPDYMVPAYFVPVPAIPLTPNRKVDHQALPDPLVSAGTGTYTAPVTELEKQLAVIWGGVLEQKSAQIGIDDNFFQMGGHSLKATILISRVKKNLGVSILLADMFRFPTIRSLAGHIQETRPTVTRGVEPVEKKEYYALSPAQKRLFILQQMDKNNTSYHMPAIMVLTGDLEQEKFTATFHCLMARHESFRTSFLIVGEEPVQRVHDIDDIHFSLSYHQEEVEYDSIIREFIRPFDFSCAPLFRAGIIQVNPQEHILMFDMHHILTDGTSQGMMVREFMEFYAGKDLPPLILQYKDYSEWMRSDWQKQALARQEAFWLKRFPRDIPVLSLPADFPRPEVQQFAGHRLGFIIGPEETMALKELAVSIQGTLFMVLLAVYQVLLGRLSGQEDILVGTPIAARRHADLEPIIGMFVNTLVLRNSPVGGLTFKQFLGEVKKDTLEAFENQEYPFEELVEKIGLARDASRNPLFDVMFALQNWSMPTLEFKGLQMKPYRYENRTAKFDLNLDAVETKDSLILGLEYSTALFKEETVRRMTGYFIHLVQEVTTDRFKLISRVEIMGEEEKGKIISLCNGAVVVSEQRGTIDGWFEDMAVKMRDVVGVVMVDSVLEGFEGSGSGLSGVKGDDKKYGGRWPQEITYGELNRGGDELARELKEHGVAAGSVVGVMMERSLEMVMAILGVLKAGAGYLPIDLDYPAGRKEYMLADSQAVLVLTRDESGHIKITANGHGGMRALPASLEKSRHSILYVIYTSGSTGRPKGVILEHGNLVNLIEYQYRSTSIDFSRVLQWTTIGFDVSFQEIFSTLLAGGRLVMMPGRLRQDIPRLFSLVQEEDICTLFLAASFVKFVFNQDEYERYWPQSVKHIVTAGEQVVIGQTFRSYLEKNQITLHNHYGPTESHVVTALSIVPGQEIPDLPGIGKPISNTVIMILDRYRRLQPVGIPGEIYIGGDQVARGYLNNPTLTGERFIKQAGGQRLYKTGDLGCWLGDGNIEFLGRIDDQVKIRGFRIELGEIESRLMEQDSIKEAVVMVRGGKEGQGREKQTEPVMVAYVVPQENRVIDLVKLRGQLSKQLPDYMMPAFFKVIEKVPLSPNGKVDRGALPAIEWTGGQEHILPANDIERKLAGLWAEVLNIDMKQLGRDDDFFQLGGHSLKAMVFIARLQRAMGVEIRLVEMFNKPTIRLLAQLLAGKQAVVQAPVQPVEKKEYYALSPSQKRLYILQQMDPGNISYNMPAVMVLQGELDKERLSMVFKKLIERHESFRTSFHTQVGEPVQRVHDSQDMDLSNHFRFNVSYYTAAEGAGQVESFVRPFDLSKAPLLRVALAEHGPGEHIFMLDMHHIISDGTSIGILVHEFMRIYGGEVLPVLRLHYKDYSGWMNDVIQTRVLKEQKAFWVERFRENIPVLSLPYDFPRPVVQGFAGNRYNFSLAGKDYEGLREIVVESESSLFIVLLAIYNIWLSALSGQEDIVTGTPVAGRRHADLEPIIGMFVNTLALRFFPGASHYFLDFLQEVKGHTLAAFDRQEYPFEELVEAVHVSRDTSRNPLFDVMMSLQNFDIPGVEMAGLKIKPYGVENRTAKFDLNLDIMERNQGLVFSLEYSTDLFKEASIARFCRYFVAIIHGVVENRQTRLQEIDILGRSEKEELLQWANGPVEPGLPARTIHGWFEEESVKVPNNVALYGQPAGGGGGVHLTYSQLEGQARELAQRLQVHGAQVDGVIALMMEPCLEMVVAIIGILKAGAGYLPVDPDYPAGRKSFMLEDSGALMVLTLSTEGEIIITGNRVASESREGEKPVCPYKTLLYVIYTSGSTGRPKGVMLEHRNLVNLIQYEYCHTSIDFSRVLQFTTISFDVSFQEIFSTLLAGGTLFLLDKEIKKDIAALFGYILQQSIKTLFLPASFLKFVLGQSLFLQHMPGSVAHIVTAGEQLLVTAGFRQMLMERGITLHNHYGPSETHVVTVLALEAPGSIPDLPPIGRPIANTGIYILNKACYLQPVGIAGELFIAGYNVGRGYLNRPGLTSEKFHPQSWLAGVGQGEARELIASLYGGHIYQTGDLARWQAGGIIEFLGRMDQQVKIRGFRVELEEIEHDLLALPHVQEAVVTARQDAKAEYYLCAYIVASVPVNPSLLREELSQRLPGFMLPARWVQIETIPLTPSGKVDRAALPGPGGERPGLDTTFLAPVSHLEKTIAGVWQEVLQLEKVGTQDNFFDLGGNSLLLLKVNMRLKECLNKEVPVMFMFKYPTIQALARHLEIKDGKTGLVAERKVRQEKLDKGLQRMKKTMVIKEKGKR